MQRALQIQVEIWGDVPQLVGGSLRLTVFFIFGASKNFFFDLIKLNLSLGTPTLRGVILLKSFNLSIGLGIGNVKNSHFRTKSGLTSNNLNNPPTHNGKLVS